MAAQKLHPIVKRRSASRWRLLTWRRPTRGWSVLREAAFASLLALLIGLTLGVPQYFLHVTDLIAILAIGVGVLALLLRVVWAAAGWLLFGLVMFIPFYGQFVPVARAVPQGCRMSVIFFNAKLLRGDFHAQVARAIASAPADLVLITETNSPDLVRAALPPDSPLRDYHWLDSRDGFFAISRYPAMAEISDSAGIRTTALRVAGRPVRIATGVAPREGQDPSQMTRFFATLHQIIDRDGPLVIGIDLNAGPQALRTRQVTQRVVDAHAESGFGLGHTFPAPGRRWGMFGTFMRLDYILTSGGLTPVQTEVLADHGASTHYPVRAELVFGGVGGDGATCPA